MYNNNNIYDNAFNHYLGLYRANYVQYFTRRWGLIPNLPSSFDNSNDIYELLAWLQRGFKQLLDDMENLANDYNELQNSLNKLLETLLPQIIRNFLKSDEFKNIIKDVINDWYNDFLKPKLSDLENRLNAKIDSLREELLTKLRDFMQLVEQKINELNNKLDNEIEKLNNKIIRLQNELEQERQARLRDRNLLNKILNNLSNSGAWTWESDNDGHFNRGRSIATGNINLFSGSGDSNEFIRTNNGSTEHDIAVGVGI